jgi:hypothetical protein
VGAAVTLHGGGAIPCGYGEPGEVAKVEPLEPPWLRSTFYRSLRSATMAVIFEYSTSDMPKPGFQSQLKHRATYNSECRREGIVHQTCSRSSASADEIRGFDDEANPALIERPGSF